MIRKMKYVIGVVLLSLISGNINEIEAINSFNVLSNPGASCFSSQTIPLRNNDCEQSLIKTLQQAEELLNKDTDNFNDIIQRIDSIRQQKTCSDVIKAIANSYYARMLYLKYESKAYIINNRTPLKDSNTGNIETWSKDVYADQILAALKEALKNPLSLKMAPESSFSSFLIDKSVKTNLYELIVGQVLQTLSDCRFMSNSGVYSFDAKEWLNGVNQFVTLSFPDEMNPFERLSLQIYQQQLRFSLETRDAIQLVAQDLQRLQYVLSLDYANLTYYRNALGDLYNTYKGSEAEILIAAPLFNELMSDFNLNRDDDLTKMVGIDSIAQLWQIANKLLRDYSNTPAACELQNLIYNIEAGACNTSMKDIIAVDQQPCVEIDIKNCSLVRLFLQDNKGRILEQQEIKGPSKINWENHKALFRPLGYGTYQIKVEAYPEKPQKPVGNWTIESEPDSVYQNILQFVVSDIKLLTSKLPDNSIQILVVNQTTGQPIDKAKVNCYLSNYNRATPLFIKTIFTDKNGLAIFNSEEGGSRFLFKAEIGDDKYLPGQTMYGWLRSQDTKRLIEKISFFTDRSIYRPGQPVYFKGILYEENSLDGTAIANRELEIIFYNNQNKVLASQRLTTDEFGAIAGEFLLPKDGLNGNYRIASSLGSCNFQVASYKRPTFEVIVDKPNEDYTIGSNIFIKGAVKSYTGVSLDNVAINYTIKYQPFRWFSESTFVGSGKSITKENGAFSFDFKAEIPANQNRPSGYYYITVSATDATGETQESMLTIPISSSSYLLEMKFLQKQPAVFNVGTSNGHYWNKKDKGEILVEVYNLSQQPVNAKGRVRLYKMGQDTLDFPVIKKDTTKTLAKQYSFEGGRPLSLDLKGLKSGKYLFVAEIKDLENRISKVEEEVVVADPSDTKLPIVADSWIFVKNDSCRVGDAVECHFGTSVKDAYLLYQVFSNSKLLITKRLVVSDEIRKISFPYLKEFGNQISMSFTFIKKNRAINRNVVIYEAIKKKELVIKKESFRDKLLPGSKETWTFMVTNQDGTPSYSQVLADMYDASLDAIYPNKWYYNFLRQNTSYQFNWVGDSFYNSQGNSNWGTYVNCPVDQENGLSFFGIEEIIHPSVITKGVFSNQSISMRKLAMKSPAPDEMIVMDDSFIEEESESGYSSADIDIRSDLSETAFFYPKLMTDSIGRLKIQFTAPEALTRWNVRLLATTQNMISGYYCTEAITRKDLMVVPNWPRFVRQNDSLCISSMIMNQSEKEQSGSCVIEIFDLQSEKVWYREEKVFNIKVGENESVSFCLRVPENKTLLGVRIWAKSKEYSDGEQQIIPVLPSKSLVTETKLLNMASAGNKEFVFANYQQPTSSTLQNLRYTVEYTGNPAWYAILALPTLASVNGQSSSAVIASFYVNTLAAYIAHSNPIIRKAIEHWTTEKESLQSPLETNEALKQILLDNAPWVLAATSERENREALMQLFNKNRLEASKEEATALLRSLQNADGGMAWWKGMPSSLFQTMDVLDKFSRLVSMNAFEAPKDIKDLQIRAINYTDRQIVELYKESLQQQGKKKWIPTYIDLMWAYTRSSYRDIPFYEGSLDIHKHILDYYRKNQKGLSLYEYALVSLTLRRYGFVHDADLINKELYRRATHSEELGTHWANNRMSSFNNVGMIRTHVLIMEALYEGGASEEEMNQMKLWLLAQKQTQQWVNAPATVDAIYGILMTGTDWLNSTNAPIVKVGNYEITVDPYLAYVDTVFSGNNMIPELGNIEIEQKGNHPGYGAAYWQYFESFEKIANHSTGIKIEKQLYIEIETDNGAALDIIREPLSLGDIVVTRLIISTDRNYEFVVLTDQRAACFEPVEQVSGYKWSENVGYYQEIKDATTNFFFSYLPQGTYVLEYRLKTNLRGVFNDGISSIQCMYAPQFIGNTQATKVIVNQ